MKKEFNTTGTCYPRFHYMMDNSKQLNYVFNLIEGGKYFTINRPRQYGKTTTMWLMVEKLKQTEDYFPIGLNFQGTDRQWHESDVKFGQMFLNEIVRSFRYSQPELAAFLAQKKAIKDLNELSDIITELMHKISKKVVLLIDEVDASSNYTAFLRFLAMLRNKYLNRHIPENYTFHSVVLVRVHDIKNLKFKLRNPSASQYNSPWNIAVDFKVTMRFNQQEIAPMLAEYSQAEEVKMDIPMIAERLYYHTSGYPFLVSKLCKTVVEDILPNKNKQNQWTTADIDKSVQLLLNEDNTNFDSLIKNLENHQDLYQLVHQIVIEGTIIPFNRYNPTIQKGIIYGVFKRNGRIKIHNRIYEQLIYDYMTSKAAMNLKAVHTYAEHFKTEDNGLDIRAALLKFQQFMKEQYHKKDKDFYERQGRIIFLAFLSPILNGHGYAFREVQTSEEKRLDVILTYFQHRYIIELKLWYGGEYHQKGIRQLSDYLEIHGVDKGFLVIFDDRKVKTWENQTIQYEGKEIFAIWV